MSVEYFATLQLILFHKVESFRIDIKVCIDAWMLTVAADYETFGKSEKECSHKGWRSTSAFRRISENDAHERVISITLKSM
jgi:hypothetical protein